MRNDIAISLLSTVIKDATGEDEFAEYIRYFQTMAKYKYDDYQQYTTGQRFIETLARWLNYFPLEDRKVVLEFLKDKLIYVSTSEMNLLAESCFPDALRKILSDSAAKTLGVSNYMLNKIIASSEYNILLRQSLFCGLSDGAKLDIFRRANTGIISHEQIYLTYELSISRITKMKDELQQDLKKPNFLNREPTDEESKFKMLFLIDDFSASGTSYLKFDESKNKLKGKIAGLYDSLFGKDETDNSANQSAMGQCFHKELKIYIILYLCTTQAKQAIEKNFDKLFDKYGHKPELVILHELDASYKINKSDNIYSVCLKDNYYDKNLIEDIHTDTNVKLGFSECSLPLVLAHNTPNNSIPLLWSYDYSKIFKGLFPRIPRHRVL